MGQSQDLLSGMLFGACGIAVLGTAAGAEALNLNRWGNNTTTSISMLSCPTLEENISIPVCCTSH